MNNSYISSLSLHNKIQQLQKLFKSRKLKLNTVEKDESKFNNKCTDALMYTEEKISEQVKDIDTILFFVEQTNTVYCMDINDLYSLVKNKRNNIFFECYQEDNLRDIDYLNPYFKVSFGGIQGLVKLDELRLLLSSEKRVFYIIPKLDENKKQLKINYTISWANALTNDQDHVSAKHCQKGSDSDIYEIRVCNTKNKENKCLVTVMSQKKKINNVFIRYITDELSPSSSDLKDIIEITDERYKNGILDVEENIPPGRNRTIETDIIKLQWKEDRERFKEQFKRYVETEKKSGDTFELEFPVNEIDNFSVPYDIIVMYQNGDKRTYVNKEDIENTKDVIHMVILGNFTITSGARFSNIISIVGNGKVFLIGSMTALFKGASLFNSDISNWDVSGVTDMFQMFKGASRFNSDISEWKVDNVTNMFQMFHGASMFNSDISEWNVENVTIMCQMFNGAENFNSNISEWKVKKVTTMAGMFKNAISFNSDISAWNVEKVITMADMFYNAISFDSDISEWNVENVTNMSRMFYNAISFHRYFTSKWNISDKTNTLQMFDIF